MRNEIRGYDPVAVDCFLARCLATPGIQRGRFPQLRGLAPSGERVTPEQIRDVRFPKAALGYQIRVVDALLDELQAAAELTTWRATALRTVVTRDPRKVPLVDAERAPLVRTAESR
ncbi:MAG: hypothetical protein JWL79_3252 [Frankiales bacterium]|nr:hypothetical protein [Frankiales bacterium]